MKKIIADYIADIRLIQKNVRLFLLGGLLVGLLSAIMHLLLNLYLKDIGHGEGFIGRVLSMFAIGGVVAAIPSAYLIARYKIKPLLIVSTIGMSASFLVLSNTPTSIVILGASFVCGLMITFLRVASGPLIMRNSTEQERTLLFSLNFANFVVAGIVGSLGGGALQKWLFGITGDIALSYQYALSLAAILGLSAVIPFALIKAKAPGKDEVARAFSLQSLKKKWRLFFKLTFPYFLLGTGAGLIIPFLNLYFRTRFNLEPSKIGVYFAVLQGTLLVAVLLSPILKRALGFIKTVVLTELVAIPFMLVLCYTENLTLAFWAFILRGALMNMGHPVGTNFAMEAVNKEDHALINSLGGIAWTSSWAVSTQVAGVIIERSGFVPSFLLAIALYLASAALYYFYFSKAEYTSNGKVVIDLDRIR